MACSICILANHARIQEFLSRGGGPVQTSRKQPDNVFNPSFISMLFQGFRGGPTFPVVGVLMIVSIETHIP